MKTLRKKLWQFIKRLCAVPTYKFGDFLVYRDEHEPDEVEGRVEAVKFGKHQYLYKINGHWYEEEYIVCRIVEET